MEVWMFGCRTAVVGRETFEETMYCDGENHFRHRRPSSGGHDLCEKVGPCPGEKEGEEEVDHPGYEVVNEIDLPWVVQTAMEIHITVPEGRIVVSQRGTDQSPHYRWFLAGSKIAPAMLFGLGTTVLSEVNREAVVRTDRDREGRKLGHIAKYLLTYENGRVKVTFLGQE